MTLSEISGRRSFSTVRRRLSRVSDSTNIHEKFEEENIFNVEATNQEDLFKTYGLFYHLKIVKRKVLAAIWLFSLVAFRRKLMTILALLYPPALMFLSLNGIYNHHVKGLGFSRDGFSLGRNIRFADLVDYFCFQIERCGSYDSEIFIRLYPRNIWTEKILYGTLNCLSIGNMIEKEKFPYENFFAKSVDDLEIQTVNSMKNKTKKQTFGLLFFFPPGKHENRAPNEVYYKVYTQDGVIPIVNELSPILEVANNEKREGAYVASRFLSLQACLELSYYEIVVEEHKHVIQIQGELTYAKVSKIIAIIKSKIVLKFFPSPSFLDSSTQSNLLVVFLWSILFSLLPGITILYQHQASLKQDGSWENMRLHGLTTNLRWTSFLLFISLYALVWDISITTTSVVYFKSSTTTNWEIFEFFVIFLAFSLVFYIWLGIIGFFSNVAAYYIGPLYTLLIGLCSTFYIMFPPESLIISSLSLMIFPSNIVAAIFHNFLGHSLQEEGTTFLDSENIFNRKDSTPDPEIIIFLFTLYIPCLVYILVKIDKAKDYLLSPRANVFNTEMLKLDYQHSKNAMIRSSSEEEDCLIIANENVDFFELFIRCCNVSKTVGNKTIIKNCNIELYRNQIVFVVGESGSGKTTFLELIGGFTSASSGDVEMESESLMTDIKLCRRVTGYCRQIPFIFEDLTVSENLRVTSMLRGTISHKRAFFQANALLELLGFIDKQQFGVTEFASGLSTTERKKLSLAMALSYNPRLILLDEVTCGHSLDSFYRMWNCIQNAALDSCVVVVTSDLEEVETYGDSLLIMKEGEIICSAPPSKLREKFGCGNMLLVEKLKGCRVDYLEKLISAHIPLMKPMTESPTSSEKFLKYQLPETKYSTLLRTLENKKYEIRIGTIKLERLKFSHVIDRVYDHVAELRNTEISMSEDKETINPTRDSLKWFFPKIIGKFLPHDPSLHALLKKRFLSYLSSKAVHEAVLVLLLIYFIFCLALPILLQRNPEGIRIPISLNIYNHPQYQVVAKFTSLHSQIYTNVLSMMFKNYSIQLKLMDSTENIATFIREISRKYSSYYESQVIFGIEITDSDMVIHYAANSHHSAPVALNLLYKMIMKAFIPSKAHFSITPISHQIKPKVVASVSLSHIVNECQMIVFFVILSFASIIPMMITKSETEHNMKRYQHILGISPIKYWSSALIVDGMMSTTFSIVLTMIFFFIKPGVICFPEIMVFLFVITLHLTWGGLTFTYLCSLIQPNSQRSFILFVMMIFASGLTKLHNSAFTHYLFKYVGWYFSPYLFLNFIEDFFHEYSIRRFCDGQKYEHKCAIFDHEGENYAPTDPWYLSLHDVGASACCVPQCYLEGSCSNARCSTLSAYFSQHILYICSMICHGPLHLILIMCIEYGPSFGVEHFLKHIAVEKEESESEESDSEEPKTSNDEIIVPTEDKTVATSKEKPMFRAEHLSVYDKGHAFLKKLSFQVDEGSLITIIGPGGCGKTILFKVLLGIIKNYRGTLHLYEQPLSGSITKALKFSIGVMFQTPTFLSDLTVVQMLTFVAELKGVKTVYLKDEVDGWLHRMDLKYIRHTKCGYLTPGTERKLGCAMAFIGQPKFYVLDEPLTFLFPIDQRKVWTCFNQMRQTKCSGVIFRNESIEEINTENFLLLKSGQVKKRGYVPEISTKIHDDYDTLQIKFCADQKDLLSDEELEEKLTILRNTILARLSPCTLRFESDSMMVYQIQFETKRLILIHSTLEALQQRLSPLIHSFTIQKRKLPEIIEDWLEEKSQRI